MRTIVHISDIHFGRADPRVVDGLLDDLKGRSVSLTVISGDLTQRARRWQFEAAAAFLRRLPSPQLVVPGNHDLPLFDIVRRVVHPLGHYIQYITPDLRPSFVDDEMAVMGINTSRRLVVRNGWLPNTKDGHISAAQLRDIESHATGLPESIIKIVVAHHPFIPAPGEPPKELVGNNTAALDRFEKCGIDVLLSGHLHVGYSGDVRSYHPTVKRSILAIHAGTAISTRRRNEPNAYNVVTIENHRIAIEARAWNGTKFESSITTRYARRDGVWHKDGNE